MSHIYATLHWAESVYIGGHINAEIPLLRKYKLAHQFRYLVWGKNGSCLNCNLARIEPHITVIPVEPRAESLGFLSSRS